MQLGILTNFKS